jgi:hypothetical protein
MITLATVDTVPANLKLGQEQRPLLDTTFAVADLSEGTGSRPAISWPGGAVVGSRGWGTRAERAGMGTQNAGEEVQSEGLGEVVVHAGGQASLAVAGQGCGRSSRRSACDGQSLRAGGSPRSRLG